MSAGGFGAAIPQIKGEWLKIGALVGLQPEGGENWLIGVVRRLNRESAQQGSVGVQTLARHGRVLEMLPEGGVPGDTVTGVLLDPVAKGAGPEIELLLRPGSTVAGQNLQYQHEGRAFLLLPTGIVEAGEDYDRARFRQMVRDTGE